MAQILLSLVLKGKRKVNSEVRARNSKPLDPQPIVDSPPATHLTPLPTKDHIMFSNHHKLQVITLYYSIMNDSIPSISQLLNNFYWATPTLFILHGVILDRAS